jgi:ribosome-interacting GTPase 1
MPANLTPQYFKAEAKYRQASSPEEELTCLQEMLREIPKHKGTDKLQAELKGKIAKAKDDAQKAHKTGKKGHSFKIPRQGAGRVVLLGGPNAGKSAFVAAVTNAKPEVAPYPFTTREPAPAMMPWEDVMVQLIDTPPITADFCEPNVLGLVRGADLVLLMVDLAADEGIDQLQDVLDHLDHTKTRLAAESSLNEEDIGLSFTRTFLTPNKIDAPGAQERLDLMHEFAQLDFPEYVISAEHGTGIENLREAIYKSLDVVRVYTKHPNHKEADYDRPFTIPRGGTVHDVAELIHKELAQNLKNARIWGQGVHDGTYVKGDHVLNDKDVVELHM